MNELQLKFSRQHTHKHEHDGEFDDIQTVNLQELKFKCCSRQIIIDRPWDRRRKE